MPDAYYMTQAQYAKHRQISQPRIAKLIRVGKLNGAYRKKGRRYFINPAKADQLLDQNLNPIYRDAGPGRPEEKAGAPLPTKSSNGRSMAEATRNLTWLRVALTKLKYDKERGALVPKDQVARQATNVGLLVRTHLESLPAKIAPELAGMRSPKKIAERLQHEMRVVLTALSHDIDKL
jgi:hypothetical protein